jgi:hypothetical protein
MLIIWAGRYINTELRPKIQNVIGGGQVLGWEDFLAKERAKKGRRYLLIPGFGHEIPLIVAAVLIGGYLAYADNFGITPVTIFLYFFSAVVVIPGWIVAVIIRIFTNLQYLNISPKQKI